jgi:very-short-patch-repair endonuclease
MTRAFNKTEAKPKRQSLRKNMPPAEVLLWSKLKDKRLKGYKFRRQYSIDNFIVDFYCPKLKLAIEIDGDSHYVEGADINDRERQSIIESYGITFLRFTNKEIYENLEGILEIIAEHLSQTSPYPSLLRRGVSLTPSPLQ